MVGKMLEAKAIVKAIYFKNPFFSCGHWTVHILANQPDSVRYIDGAGSIPLNSLYFVISWSLSGRLPQSAAYLG